MSKVIKNRTSAWINLVASAVVLMVPVYISDEIRRDLIAPIACLFKKCEVVPEPWQYICLLIFVPSCIAMIAISIYELLRAATYDNLLRRNQEYTEERNSINKKVESFKKLYPKALSELFSFGHVGSHDRITFFLFDKDCNHFQEFHRVSSNANFYTSNQKLYPPNQGCIGKAWENGFHFDNTFPDPDQNHKDYIQYTCGNYNFKAEEAQGLRMKSRLYCSWSIKDVDGVEDVAVIVLESTNSARWQEAQLKQIFEVNKAALRQYIGLVNGIIPQLSIAKNMNL